MPAGSGAFDAPTGDDGGALASGRKWWLIDVTIRRVLRIAHIRTTDLTHGFQGAGSKKLLRFYKLWAPIYEASVRLDPGYMRGLRRMVSLAVRSGDRTLDVGSGTGLSTLLAASVAAQVVAVDPSAEMSAKLRKKVRVRQIDNIEIRQSFFPDALMPGETFDSVISSFMLAHLDRPERERAMAAIFHCLEPGGRVGLFAAQGEIASTFQTRDEIEGCLAAAGFESWEVRDLFDIYRIVVATRSSSSSPSGDGRTPG